MYHRSRQQRKIPIPVPPPSTFAVIIVVVVIFDVVRGGVDENVVDFTVEAAEDFGRHEKKLEKTDDIRETRNGRIEHLLIEFQEGKVTFICNPR